jgi:pseudouridine kinase
MTSGYVLVIGSAGIDVKAKTVNALTWDSVNLGQVRNSVGGVARNIAENLERLSVQTVLLTAVPRDLVGKRIIRHSKSSGINCKYVRGIEGARACAFVTLLKPDGEPLVSIADYDIMNYVDTRYLRRHETLFANARMIVLDATLTEEALATVFDLAQKYGVRVCADPTSPMLAGRLCDYLDKLYLVTPNAAETTVLCGLDNPARDRDTALAAARQLVSLGAEIAVVTLSEQGVAYAAGVSSGYMRAAQIDVVDSTGAGDAFSGAVIFGLLNDVEVDEAMRLGITAASLTLQTRETVLPDLTEELLYAKLVV